MGLKIVFFGTPEFAVATAEAIRKSASHRIVGAVTAPDRPAGRGLHTKASAVKEWAWSHSVPLEQPESLRDPDFLDRLQAWNADCFVVVAFRMLPKSVWSMPHKGTFNIHASLLPDFRGAAPIHWAVYNGRLETGVTSFLLNEEIDTGAILLQEKTPIGPDENTGNLYERLQKMGAELAVKTLDGLETNALIPVPQEEKTSSDAPKIKRPHQFLPWHRPVSEWYNAFRGMSPFPGALASIKIDQIIEFKIIKCVYITNRYNTIPRHSLKEGRWFIEGPEGALELLEIQWPGKKPLAVDAFLRGQPLSGFYEIV